MSRRRPRRSSRTDSSRWPLPASTGWFRPCVECGWPLSAAPRPTGDEGGQRGGRRARAAPRGRRAGRAGRPAHPPADLHRAAPPGPAGAPGEPRRTRQSERKVHGLHHRRAGHGGRLRRDREPYQKLGPPPASLQVTHTVARVSDKAPWAARSTSNHPTPSGSSGYTINS